MPWLIVTFLPAPLTTEILSLACNYSEKIFLWAFKRKPKLGQNVEGGMVREQGSKSAFLWWVGFQRLWVLSAIWGPLPKILPSATHSIVVIITIYIYRQHLWRILQLTKCLLHEVPHLSAKVLRAVRWLGCTHSAIKMYLLASLEGSEGKLHPVLSTLQCG